jgi:CRISPR-associated protein Cmr3
MYAAAVGKPIYLGGWDMKARAPKPMLKGVPAGSVYYLRVDEGDPAALFKACHGQSISEAREQAGFGLCYAGAAMPAPTS